MYKKILLIFMCIFVFVSCSASIISPNTKKYGIDVAQEDSAIMAQIKEHLEQSYKDKGYYELVFIGIPKSKYSQATSISGMILKEASKISADNIIVDISNIDFQNYTVPASMFAGNPDNKKTILKFIFPENKIKVIESFAFSYLFYNLKELKIPDSVITINARAFQLNYALEKVVLGNNVQTIEEDAFLYSTALTELTIPASLKVIKDKAFSSSIKLTKLIYLGTLPNSISVGKYVFTSAKFGTLILPNVDNINTSDWQYFLGGYFTDIRKE